MKHLITIFIITVILTTSLYGQKVTVNVPDVYTSGEEGTLNNAIQDAIDAGTLSNTIFELSLFGVYVVTGTITVPAGEHLEIVAPEPGTTDTEAPPQIMWTATGGVDTELLIDCFGSLTLKNVWVRYADASGAQVGCTIQFGPDPNADAEIGTFENVIFDYSPCPQNSSSGAVAVTSEHFRGTFRNCYFRNCIDTHLRYYGRALSFPYNTSGYHIDYVLFENCTFANMGYVYMQEQAEYGDNVHFNHCTFVNIMMHSLEQGWWWNMSVTNSIFVNAWMFGDNPSQRDQDNDGIYSDINGGTFRIDPADSLGFEVPFTDQDRHILFSNSSYFLEEWLTDWMQNNPYSQELHRERRDDEIPIPMPMLSPETIAFIDSLDNNGEKVFPNINKRDLHDGVDPGFISPPTNIDSIKAYLECKWRPDNCDGDWSWNPESGAAQEWPLPENLTYTNETLKTAGMGGFPLGDLYRWWPTEYAQWEAQAEDEWDAIIGELGLTGVKEITGRKLPSDFVLGRSYPNPFNPATRIEYSVPKTAHVTLKVYNSLGQEVATLFDGTQQAGNYLATFDGRGLTSGVYIYKLQSDGVSLTKKFTLMK